MTDLCEYHDKLSEMPEEVQPIFKVFSDNFYCVNTIEAVDELTKTWKITLARPSMRSCFQGNCIWDKANMIERDGEFNVIEYDDRSDSQISITFRAEAPTNKIVLLHKSTLRRKY